MTSKFCIQFPTPKSKSNHKFRFRLADERNTHSHTLQSALSSAESLVVTLSRRGRLFPWKYFGPKGQALEFYELCGQFSVEVSQGATEMEGCLRGVSDFLVAEQVLKDLETVEKVFREKVLKALEQALEKGQGVEYDELIWETRKLRKRAGKALGGK